MADRDSAAVDVGESDFEREVLERSAETPVVVDFWAPWCAPCRVLGPLLEDLVEEHRGEIRLTKVNVDEAPALAHHYAVRSIPTVLGFREGEVVSEFTGAQPEPVVRRFVTALLPTPADREARAGDERAASGDGPGAAARYRAALADESRHPRALLGLARLLAERGQRDEALDLLERMPPGAPVAPEAERLAAQLRTSSPGGQEESELRARIAQDPGDLDARLELGRSLASAGRHQEALAELLEVVKRDPDFADQAARKTMIDLFAVLGPEDPLTQRFRGELARVLFR